MMTLPENLESLPKQEIREIKYRLLKTIDYIEAQRIQLRQELTSIYDSLTRINRALGRKVFRGESVKVAQPKDETLDTLVVTDHAVLRYIERFKLLDVEKLRNAIKDSIPNEVIKGKYEVVELDDIGYRLAFDSGKTTVLTTIKID